MTARCSGPVHKAPRAGGPCPCGRVVRVRPAGRRGPDQPAPRLSLADWLLHTLGADLAAIPNRPDLPVTARAELFTATHAAYAVVEAVTYEASVRGYATRRPHHDPSAAAALDALAVVYRDRPGFREDWTA